MMIWQSYLLGLFFIRVWAVVPNYACFKCIKPFSTSRHGTGPDWALQLMPHLDREAGCMIFAMISRDAMQLNTGLQPRLEQDPEVSECIVSKDFRVEDYTPGQIYSRFGEFNGVYAIGYAWYEPRTQETGAHWFTPKGHAHNLFTTVLWLKQVPPPEEVDENERYYEILGAWTPQSHYKTKESLVFQPNTQHIMVGKGFRKNDKNVEWENTFFTQYKGRAYHLAQWEFMTSAARSMLNAGGLWGKEVFPLRDDVPEVKNGRESTKFQSFSTLLEMAWPLEGRFDKDDVQEPPLPSYVDSPRIDVEKWKKRHQLPIDLGG